MSIALSFLSRNKSSVFLLALALIVGGVGASANNHLNSPSGGYLLCVNSRTQVVTYPGTLSCPQESKELVLGAQGVAGPIGLQGVAGPKGEPGRDVTGGRGPDRSIDELFLCDGLDVDLVADERCRIGFKGPAGGVIFFVDYHDQYEGFNYLEAAPKGWSLNVRVKQGGPRGETNNGGQGDARMNHCTKNDSLMNTSKFDWDVGRGESNTAALLVKCQGGAIRAAANYAVGSFDDWFLPSLGELQLLYFNGRTYESGLTNEIYWSSSVGFSPNMNRPWIRHFQYGDEATNLYNTINFVRPVRAF